MKRQRSNTQLVRVLLRELSERGLKVYEANNDTVERDFVCATLQSYTYGHQRATETFIEGEMP